MCVCVTEQTSVWAPSEITEVEMVTTQMDETSAEPKVPLSLDPIVDSNVQHANVQHANVQHNIVQHVFLPKTV